MNSNNNNNNKSPAGRPRDIGFYALLFIILAATIFILLSNKEPEIISYAQLKQFFIDEQVTYFKVSDESLMLRLNTPYNGHTEVTQRLYSVSLFYEDMHELYEAQHAKGLITDYDFPPGWQMPWWLTFVPYLLITVVFLGFWFFMMNRAGGEGGGGGLRGQFKFGKARTRNAKDDKKKITFADVASAEEEKEELKEIVEFLKDPRRFVDMGARIPSGVLLVGPPGTGKTYLAKAVAGEANVQFLSISGSDFVELYVGVGASRVRDLFEQAKKSSPSIIFIDEIDAVGRQRGAGLGGGHDEREQTLNQLLVEMDGFGTNEGVIVMAATNRQDILDRALLRPGRFDRIVYVGLPDIKGREEILRIHSKEKRLAEDISMKKVAQSTIGFTPADLENLMNESALHAARNNNPLIRMSDVEEAMIKVIAGPAKKSRIVTEADRKITAFHEAGHAVASFWLEHSDPVHQISIIPRGQAAGMTMYRPTEDKSFKSRNEMYDSIVSLLGGRVSEALVIKDISTGASNDLQRASEIARNMVMRYGMSELLGPVTFTSENSEVFLGRDYAQTKPYSESVATQIDEEVKRILDESYVRCEAILREHGAILAETAKYLKDNETMDGDVFRYLCKNGVLPEEFDITTGDDDITFPIIPEVEDE
ncbi:MAG: ATP-dependent zinc metalloprotease FtsH [Oscillospiraceae bacterium]|nr:ATP-dependent zinc metalloprotease FtsH [Oscillospiraceae bacterium]